MNILILLGVFLVLVMIGLPIAYCTGLAAVASLIFAGTPLTAAAQRVFAAADSFTYLAIPFPLALHIAIELCPHSNLELIV